jgi:hypothetical protein
VFAGRQTHSVTPILSSWAQESNVKILFPREVKGDALRLLNFQRFRQKFSREVFREHVGWCEQRVDSRALERAIADENPFDFIKRRCARPVASPVVVAR